MAFLGLAQDTDKKGDVGVGAARGSLEGAQPSPAVGLPVPSLKLLGVSPVQTNETPPWRAMRFLALGFGGSFGSRTPQTTGEILSRPCSQDTSFQLLLSLVQRTSGWCHLGPSV